MKKSVQPKQYLWKISSCSQNAFIFRQPDQITYARNKTQAAKIYLDYFFPSSNYIPEFHKDTEIFRAMIPGEPAESVIHKLPNWVVTLIEKDQAPILLKYKVLLNEAEHPF